MKNFVARKLEQMPTSIFSVISQLSFEYKAVNLGQGFPDFNGPEWIFDFALNAMKEGKNQYAPSMGIHSLRQSICDYQKKYYGLDYQLDEVIVTAGATEALYSAFNAFIDAGDEVVLFEPYYDSYYSDVILAGGIPKIVTLRKPDFNFDYEELEKAISFKTKIIVINNPHNPTGKVFSIEELKFIASLAIKHNLMIISDEVYEFLTYDGVQHIPIASLPGMKERTITISSCGKTFGFTGWKIGYAISCADWIKAIHGIHQWTTFAVNTPGQHAMANAFTKLNEYIPDFRKTYQEKLNFIYNQLLTTKFKPHRPKGSYFIMVDIPQELGNDYDASIKLIKEYGVATIPPSVFYSKSDEGKTMLRICFAKQEQTLTEGINRLKAV